MPRTNNSASRSSTFAVAVVAGVITGCLITAALSGHHLFGADALKAAGGFKDVKPIEGVGNFIDALKGNLSWLLITTLTLVVLVVGFLFMVGHSRAHDFAIRVVVGVAIVACAGGIVA